MAREGRSRKGRKAISIVGELNPSSKLSNLERKEIIYKYTLEGISSRKLAKEYGVTKTLILGIIKKKDYFLSL